MNAVGPHKARIALAANESEFASSLRRFSWINGCHRRSDFVASRPMMVARILFLSTVILASLAPGPGRGEEGQVIIVSPHNEAIRYEFGRAFALWHEKQFNEPATAEWRDAGGTSDALRFVQSEFARKPNGIGIDIFFGGGQ